LVFLEEIPCQPCSSVVLSLPLIIHFSLDNKQAFSHHR